MADPAPKDRSGFGATVGLGLATAALSAVASAKPWFRLGSDRAASPGIPGSQTSIDMPLALALSLVVLAGWGAVLVSRGLLRRVAAAVALAAALGVVASVARAPFSLPDDLRHAIGPAGAGLDVHPTGWFVTSAVASALSALVLVAAWRMVPRWPTMSSRYDAPATRAAVVAADPTDQKDLWKALDEGHDPTDSSGPSSP
jgi:uncharacterized membrane protein (TIGR02234 family)